MPITGTQGGVYPYTSHRAVVVSRKNVQRGMSAVYHQSWGGPLQQPVNTPVAAKVANGILTALAGPNTTTITPTLNGALATAGLVTLIPLYGPWTGGRNVIITVTHASAVVAESGVITGIDIYGRAIQEAWSVTAGTASKTFTGKKAFKYVSSVTITAATDASANTNVIGDGDALGLDVRATIGLVNGALKEIMDAGILATGTIVGFDAVNSGWGTSFTADPRGTYLPAAVPNAARVYDLWYVSDDPEFSDTGKVLGQG